MGKICKIKLDNVQISTLRASEYKISVLDTPEIWFSKAVQAKHASDILKRHRRKSNCCHDARCDVWNQQMGNLANAVEAIFKCYARVQKISTEKHDVWMTHNLAKMAKELSLNIDEDDEKVLKILTHYHSYARFPIGRGSFEMVHTSVLRTIGGRKVERKNIVIAAEAIYTHVLGLLKSRKFSSRGGFSLPPCQCLKP